MPRYLGDLGLRPVVSQQDNTAEPEKRALDEDVENDEDDGHDGDDDDGEDVGNVFVSVINVNHLTSSKNLCEKRRKSQLCQPEVNVDENKEEIEDRGKQKIAASFELN